MLKRAHYETRAVIIMIYGGDVKEAEVDVQLLLIPYCAVGYKKYRSNLGRVYCPMFEMRRLQEYSHVEQDFCYSFFF